jgi:hypothetical protein
MLGSREGDTQHPRSQARQEKTESTARLHFDLLEWPAESGEAGVAREGAWVGEESELSPYQLP